MVSSKVVVAEDALDALMELALVFLCHMVLLYRFLLLVYMLLAVADHTTFAFPDMSDNISRTTELTAIFRGLEVIVNCSVVIHGSCENLSIPLEFSLWLVQLLSVF